MTTDNRPTWDQTWLAIATTIAMRSRCDRRQVGAVIVTRDNRVAAVSYNGPPRARHLEGTCTAWCPRAMIDQVAAGIVPLGDLTDYSTCATIHAEANALLRADYTQIQGGTIYVSSAMCLNCAKLVANSGIRRVVHVVSELDSHRLPDQVEELLRSSSVNVVRARRNDDGSGEQLPPDGGGT